MKKIYLLITFCMVSVLGYGQTASSYAFSRLSGAYNSLVGTTADSITAYGIISDDSGTVNIPIGFTFNFCGVNYTTCTGNANGVLSLSDSIASADVDTSHISAGWLMPLWDNLFGVGKTAYYQTTGTPGSRVFTLEWRNWSVFDNTDASLNFQVKLYEGTNVVQFVYGNSVLSPTDAAIGIGNNDTDFQTLPTTAATSTDTLFSTSCSQPDSGTILQWCPPLTAPTAITGTAAVCVGSATFLTDTTSGGVWSSSNTSVASAVSTGGPLGVVIGIAPGTATISYTISNACTSIAIMVLATVNPLPVVDTITGGGSYCASTGGVHTGLSGSSLGVRYQLFRNDTAAVGSPVAGSGSAIDFGLDTAAGIYTVVATDTTTGCTSNMHGSDTIVINPLPAVHTVTGGGGYCAGGTGIHIGLNGSDAGISYQLYNHLSATVDTPVTGTGSALDFGLYTVADTYVVIATNTLTACVSNMLGRDTIMINPLPAIDTVFGGGSYCESRPGVAIGLNGSDTGIRYQLYYHDTTAIGAPISGTGDSIHFGLDTGAGGYTVIATHTATGCKSVMADSAVITVIPYVVPSVTIGSSITNICQGAPVTFSAIPVHGGDEPGYQWEVNDTVVGFGSSYSYTPANGNVVSVRLISDAVCAIPDTVKDTIQVVVHPHETPAVTLSVAPGDTVCQGAAVVVTATPGFGGPEPSYTWVKNTHVVVASDSTYSYIPSDGDDIYVIMQSNYFCRSATTAYSNVIAMTVEPAVVPSFSIAVHPGTLVSTGTEVTLTAVVTDGGPHPAFQWYLHGAVIVGATSATYSGIFEDKDSVSCIVTRGDACNLPAFNSVILRVGNLDVKQVASAGGDIKLVPNPNKGAFTINGTLGGSATGANEEVSVEITDMLGQVVYKNKIMSQNGMVNDQVQVNHILANGVYILNLRSESGSNAIRFVIEQ